MPVTHVHSDSEFRSLLTNNNWAYGPKLFVVDYSAKWCGPCKMIAPVFSSLSDKHSHDNFQFLHVDVDECGDVAQEQGIRAMPTFVFYKNTVSTELARIQGANAQALEAKINELGASFKPNPFAGEGNKLGGSSSSSTPLNVSGGGGGLTADEIQSISQSKVEFDSGSCKVGFRFQPAVQGGALAGFKPTLRINGTEPVSKLRLFIDSVLELANISTPYQLNNSYPPGPLNESACVNDAGLAGGLVIVKFN